MAAAKSTRIHVCLSPELARKIAHLERCLSSSRTEIIQRAIERYYVEVASEVGDAREILARTGFVGCAEGAIDLSRS